MPDNTDLLADIADEDELDDIVDALKELADEHGRTNVMYAINHLTFGYEDWYHADIEGNKLVTEGERSLAEMRREKTEHRDRED